MEITQEGKIPETAKPGPDEKFKGVCSFCKTEFIFRTSEGTYQTYRTARSFTVICPLCERAAYVPI